MPFNKNISSIRDYEDVVAVIENGYVKGLIEGDFSTVMASFHPQATMHGYSEGEFSTGSIQSLTAYMDRYGAGPDIKARIDVLDMTTTTAIVRIELESTACDGDYTDYHSLAKIDGQWKVMCKLFHEYDK